MIDLLHENSHEDEAKLAKSISEYLSEENYLCDLH